MAKKKIEDADKLLQTIIDGMHEKSAQEVISLNLTNIPNSVCNYFVICHADSTTHAHTIAEHVEVSVKKKLKEHAWHKEGYENMQWILLDYSNIVVHVFQKDAREYYNIERLWADAEIKKHLEEVKLPKPKRNVRRVQ